MREYESMIHVKRIGTEESCQIRFYVQKEGVFICGKPKEIRRLLSNYANRYRTVKEMITQHLN